MKSTRSALPALAAALALGSLLGGCVVVPARPYPYYSSGEAVMVAPPPPQPEVIGVAPGPNFIWIGGFWNWVGGRHVWVGGHWEDRRPDRQWVPHQWHRDGDGWRLNPGHWDRR